MKQLLKVTGVITETKKNRIVNKRIVLSNNQSRRISVTEDYCLDDQVEISSRNVMRRAM